MRPAIKIFMYFLCPEFLFESPLWTIRSHILSLTFCFVCYCSRTQDSDSSGKQRDSDIKKESSVFSNNNSPPSIGDYSHKHRDRIDKMNDKTIYEDMSRTDKCDSMDTASTEIDVTNRWQHSPNHSPVSDRENLSWNDRVNRMEVGQEAK